jgi:hypothetical protein
MFILYYTIIKYYLQINHQYNIIYKSQLLFSIKFCYNLIFINTIFIMKKKTFTQARIRAALSVKVLLFRINSSFEVFLDIFCFIPGLT